MLLLTWKKAWIVLLVMGCGWVWAEDPGTGYWPSLKSAFPKIDRDGNGELSLAEIDLSIADPMLRGEAAAAAVALRRSVKAHPSNKGPWKWKDLEELSKTPPQGKKKPPDVEAFHKAALKRIQASPPSLYGPEGPRLESIHQGRLGDCFCLAPLGAMTKKDPERVKKLFEAGPEGTIRVRLGNETIEVSPLTDGEKALVASTSGEGAWVPLYEKAMGILIAQKKSKVTTPLGAVGSGGSAGTALSLLTGHPIERFSLKPWKEPGTSQKDLPQKLENLRSGLEKAMNDGRLVCGGTGAKVEVPGIHGNHAYAVLGYDRKTDRVTFWNPHGQNFTPKGPEGIQNGYQVKKGVFQAPLTEVVVWFGGFSWEAPQATKP